MICKKCKIEKPKLKAEHPPGNSKRSYYRDANGRLWRGNTCPDCYWSKESKCVMNEYDDGEEYSFKEVAVMPQKKKWNRFCSICKGQLTYPRYYYHEECSNKVGLDVADNMVYHILGF